MKFAYADPPYFGMGKKMYSTWHPEAHLWDEQSTHLQLIVRLESEFPDGWALSCNPSDLRWLLPACPADCRVAAWCKTFHQIRPTSTQFAWEPVIWRTTKKEPKRSPMVRDWLSCPRTNRKGVPGAKPLQFNLWVLELLCFSRDEDELIDLFPGSGGMADALKVGSLWEVAQ